VAENGTAVPVSRQIVTNRDLRALEGGLSMLANTPLPKDAKAPIYNAFMMRVLRVIGTYRVLFEALGETEQKIRQRYQDDAEAKPDAANPEGKPFGAKQREFDREIRELWDTKLENVPASPVQFDLGAFDAAGIAAPAALLESLGPVFAWPAEPTA
jgi:hypothetical protein